MQVTWKMANGRKISAQVAEGETLKDAALANNVPHITGDCGGNMSCATCHVIVAPQWVAKTGTPDEFEDAILDVTEAPREQNSRLSCQIRMHAELDGLELLVPEP